MPGGIHAPVEVLLSWPEANYVNAIERPKLVLIFACIFGPLTIVLLLARLWVRIHIQQNAGIDDWLMVVAIFPITALTIITPITTEKYDFNKHVWDVKPDRYVTQRKFVLVIETVFCFASGLVKISILLFYRRLSSRTVSTTFRRATWFTIIFIVMYSMAFILVPIFGCSPISAFWDQVDPVKITQGYKYKCFNEGADVVAASVISAVQDLATAILPTFMYWNLHLPFRQKLALSCIFAIAYCVVAMGAVRVYFGWVIFFDSYDSTWSTWGSFLWAMLELHIGAMCANAPALKVFFQHTLQVEKFTHRTKSRSRSTGDISGSQQHTASSKLSIAGFRRDSRTQGHNGYFREPHIDVSVDMHGGLHVQESGTMHTSMPDPTQFPSSHFDESRKALRPYDTDSDIDLEIDIEMGSWETGTLALKSKSCWDDEHAWNVNKETQALPSMPSLPQPLASVTSAATTSEVALVPVSPKSNSHWWRATM